MAGAALVGLALAAAPVAAQSAAPATGTEEFDPSVLEGLTDHDKEALAEAVGSGAGLPLTLITGDQLMVSVDGDGQPGVQEVVAADRGGAPPVFYTVRHHDQTHVVPSDALPLVHAGVLDWSLFDIEQLAELAAAGTVGEVPLIVAYDSEADARANTMDLAGATLEGELSSLDAKVLTVGGDGAWWREAVTQQDAYAGHQFTPTLAPAGPLDGAEKVWLDGLSEITLDESVPQVGAPSAWEAGFDGTGVLVAVLDTGIDADHPDVSANLVEAVDFTGEAPDAVDGHGHGTHVAATIAGSGDAADGLRAGVAPGADLLVGKVCNDQGECPHSAMIAGMEWAAASGARVVNMSIGGGASDGTDPNSLAVNELSAEYGTLFVISAGNDGPGAFTVGSPGAADAALTVAAVDKKDEMASFSSRGPRVGDGALKPDIAAPGVGIVAARASGTSMGTVVDDFYTSANGTSMASPHVAGGAAIAAQQHPEMNGEELKSLLMGTATDLGHDIYAQGAGRLDVGEAVEATIYADGRVIFGALPYPHEPVTQTATFVNVTDEPTTLALNAEFTDGKGEPAPSGLFVLDQQEITVPANGTATVDVTVDGRVLSSGGLYGRYSGTITASDAAGAERARAMVSALVEEERFPVDIEIAGTPDGTTVGTILIVPMDDQTYLHSGLITVDGSVDATANLFDGTYAMSVAVTWVEDGVEQTALLMEPELVVTGRDAVTLDVADAERFAVQSAQVGADSGKDLDLYTASVDLARTSVTGDWGLAARLTTKGPAGQGPEQVEPEWWLLPTQSVEDGSFEVSADVVLYREPSTLRVLGGGSPLALDSRYLTPDVSDDGSMVYWTEGAEVRARSIVQPVPRFEQSAPRDLVHAGKGTVDELRAAGVEGKVALLTATDVCVSWSCQYEAVHDRVEAAAELGAEGVLIAGQSGHVYLSDPPALPIECSGGLENCPPVEAYSSIPVLTIPADEAQLLIDRMEGTGRTMLQVQGSGLVSEVFLLPFRDDRVPAMPYHLNVNELHRSTHRIHSPEPGETKTLAWTRVSEESDEVVADLQAPRLATPIEATVYVPRGGPGTVDQFHVGVQEFVDTNVAFLTDPQLNSPVAMAPGERQVVDVTGTSSSHTWNSGPQVPGASSVTIAAADHQLMPGVCSGCRAGDTFWPTIHLTGSSGQATTHMTGLENDTGAGIWLLNADGCVDCTLTLAGPDGEVLTPTVTRLEVTDAVAPAAAATPQGDNTRPHSFLDNRWITTIDTEVTP